MQDMHTQICDFLWFGYVPSAAKSAEHFAYYEKLLGDDTIEIFDWKDPSSAKRLLIRIVEEHTIGKGLTEICLPLSAGLDSRALLGAALEIFPGEKILAFTLGHEGTDDFDKARQFTRDILPNHLQIESTMQEWDTAERVAQVSQRPNDYVRDLGEFSGVANPILCDLRRLPQLKGFLGDALSGKKLPDRISGRWVDAVRAYANRFRAYKGPVALTPQQYDPLSALPAEPFSGGARMLLDDQVQFVFRQEQHIRKSFWMNVTPGSDIAKPVFPFDDPRWVRSFLLLPTELRLHQGFYRHFLVTSFPKIFPDLRDWRSKQAMKTPPTSTKPSVPPAPANTAPNAAASESATPSVPPTPAEISTAALDAQIQASKIARSKSHIDFGTIFDTDISFRNFCRENLTDLAKRDILTWIDIEGLLQQSENGRAGEFGRTLYGLASLEINLKVGKFPIPV